MTNRTPNFIVIGLLIVIFLLGTYYMSCSSTTAELKRTLEDFEERIRTVSGLYPTVQGSSCVFLVVIKK